MDGSIWFFLALIVASVALGAVLADVRRRLLTIKQNPGRCSSCETPMSLRRVVFSVWPGCSVTTRRP
jgi:hypothetical protein